MKIGLITPYSGSNLGDGAIQEAVIANIRKRYPDAHIHGFTLNPEVTSRLHKINCSPLTALPILHYWMPASLNTNMIWENERQSFNISKNIKHFIKKIPLANTLIKNLRRCKKALCILVSESKLIWNGYQMLTDFDLLIVSGGGQLDDYWGGAWGHPFILLKWGLIAKATKTRYVFLSVGTCTFESRLSAVFLKLALKMASYRSYRDETSKRLLDRFDFTHNDKVYPDLAFSLDPETQREIITTLEDKVVIGISPIAYLSSYYWPKKDLHVYNTYIDGLKAFIATLLDDGYYVILFHTSGTDKYAVEEILEWMQNENSIKNLQNLEVASTKDVKELLIMIAGVEIVVASRLHGVILSHLMNKPVLAVSYDRKVRTYMEDAGQNEFCLDIHNVDNRLFSNTFQTILLNKEFIKKRLKDRSDEYHSALSIQFDEILNPTRRRCNKCS